MISNSGQNEIESLESSLNFLKTEFPKDVDTVCPPLDAVNSIVARLSIIRGTPNESST